jgi:hypothetical protein
MPAVLPRGLHVPTYRRKLENIMQNLASLKANKGGGGDIPNPRSLYTSKGR